MTEIKNTIKMYYNYSSKKNSSATAWKFSVQTVKTLGGRNKHRPFFTADIFNIVPGKAQV